jgi:DMSO/TMAO reductase YedYZ molybdopterin-dependent catalytic subunit
MVRQAKKFSMSDLRRFPSLSRILFIECSGNTATEWSGPRMKTVQGTHGATSVAEWTGVKLSTILNEAGLRRSSGWLLAEGGDAAQMARSIPLEKALADCFLAYGQNGEALRPEQGYPLRLIAPGYEGNVHIKWLRRLEVSDQPFMTREETSKYTDLLPSGKAVQFSFEMDAQVRDHLSPPAKCCSMDQAFTKSRGWPGQAAVRFAALRFLSTVDGTGHLPNCNSRYCQCVIRDFDFPGAGMAGRRSCKAAASMRQATASRH